MPPIGRGLADALESGQPKDWKEQNLHLNSTPITASTPALPHNTTNYFKNIYTNEWTSPPQQPPPQLGYGPQTPGAYQGTRRRVSHQPRIGGLHGPNHPPYRHADNGAPTTEHPTFGDTTHFGTEDLLRPSHFRAPTAPSTRHPLSHLRDAVGVNNTKLNDEIRRIQQEHHCEPEEAVNYLFDNIRYWSRESVDRHVAIVNELQKLKKEANEMEEQIRGVEEENADLIKTPAQRPRFHGTPYDTPTPAPRPPPAAPQLTPNGPMYAMTQAPGLQYPPHPYGPPGGSYGQPSQPALWGGAMTTSRPSELVRNAPAWKVDTTIPKSLRVPLMANPIPNFGGGGNIEATYEFIKALEHHTRLLQDDFNDAQLIKYTFAYLKGGVSEWALAWKEHQVRNNLAPSWDRFMTDFKLQWLPANASTHLANKLDKMEMKAHKVDEFNHDFTSTLGLLGIYNLHAISEHDQYYKLYLSKIRDPATLTTIGQASFSTTVSNSFTKPQAKKTTSTTLHSVETSTSSETANAAQVRPSKRNEGSPRQCYFCQSPDHILRFCELKKEALALIRGNQGKEKKGEGKEKDTKEGKDGGSGKE
ncbi:hypothetical protein BJ508DRAFT_329350 [Ascobolus immersus RN42]|uniref:Ty3 transposon capsid-like protein domain-containing protein n=1 Tax=Ascobolus immersus RN42 TaxID=1160509 RepID=A0A3N4I9E7_ASCIM|nr:hypothetical protein BJ508DRAFT_329350 [Ascobolus immersus RN42]